MLLQNIIKLWLFSELHTVYYILYYELHTLFTLYCTYCILKECSVCQLFTLRYTGRLLRMHFKQINSERELLLLLFLKMKIYQQMLGFGYNVAVHCIVGNIRQDKLVRWILGISSESVYLHIWEIFGILQILLVYIHLARLHTTFWLISTYCWCSMQFFENSLCVTISTSIHFCL